MVLHELTASVTISFQLRNPLCLVLSPIASLDVSSLSFIHLYQLQVEREVERSQ